MTYTEIDPYFLLPEKIEELEYNYVKSANYDGKNLVFTFDDDSTLSIDSAILTQSYNEYPEPIRSIMVPKYSNCPNCGAPVIDNHCSYCGTNGLYESKIIY